MKALFLFSIGLLLGRNAFAQIPPESSFLLQGGTVHTISGPVIQNGSVLVRDGRIIGVGQNLSAPEGARTIDVTGQHVYPGMIDSAASIDPVHIPGARANGVTSVVDIPAGDPLPRQTKLLRLGGDSEPIPAMIHLRFPAIETRPVPPHEPDDDDAEPGSAPTIPFSVAKRKYDREMKALNAFFDGARRYRKAKLAHTRGLRVNPRYEGMLPVLEGTEPVFVTAVREREIREAIGFASRQKIRIVLADAFEAYKVIPLIKSSNIPVVLGPTFSLPLDVDDPYDRAYTTPGELAKAGIKFAIASFSSKSSRNLPYQAAAAVPFGLDHDEAYKAVSLNAAEIFGLGKRFGSIDEGKTADLIVTDGDPLEARTHVNLLFIDGKPVSLDTRQKELYQKYLARP